MKNMFQKLLIGIGFLFLNANCMEQNEANDAAIDYHWVLSKKNQIPKDFLISKQIPTLQEKSLLVFHEYVKKNIKKYTYDEFKDIKEKLEHRGFGNFWYALLTDSFSGEWELLAAPEGKEHYRPIYSGNLIHWYDGINWDMIAYSPNGQFIAKISEDFKTCNLFKNDDTSLLASFSGNINTRVVFSSHSDLLVLYDNLNRLKIIDVCNNTENIISLEPTFQNSDFIQDIAFSPNNSLFLVSTFLGIYLIKNEVPYTPLKLPISDCIGSIIFNPSGTIAGLQIAHTESVALLDLTNGTMKLFDDVGRIHAITTSNKIISVQSKKIPEVDDYRPVIIIYDFDGKIIKKYKMPADVMIYFITSKHSTIESPIFIQEKLIVRNVSFRDLKLHEFYIPKKLDCQELYLKLKKELN